MRKSIAIVLMASQMSSANISRIASQDAIGGGSTAPSATYPATPTANNLLIASGFCNVACASVSAPSGFSTAQTVLFNVSNRCEFIFYKLAAGTESSISATCTAATVGKIHIYEYTGNSNPIVLDGTNTNTGSSTTTINSNSINTTNANDLLFVSLGSANTLSAGSCDSGFSARSIDASTIHAFDCDQIVSATGNYSTNATWTGAGSVGITFATFKAPSAVVAPRRSLIGVGL